MGSAASTATAVVSMPFGMSRKPFKAERHKVPLNVAVSACLVMQRYVRRHLARNKLKALRNKAKEEEFAATEYLNSVRFQRVKSDRHNEMGILRRSYAAMEGSEPMRGFGSFSMEAGSFGDGHQSDAMFHSPLRRASAVHPRAAAKAAAPQPKENILVYPFIGFVIKAKLYNSGRKVFINLCHSPRMPQATAAPIRTWTEEKHHDDEGEVVVDEVIVIDVVIPSSDFDDCFLYKDGSGLVPSGPHVKDQLSDLCIMLLNSMDHCPDSSAPPVPGVRSPEDYRLSPHTSWPKIKRGYVGSLSPLVYDPSDRTLTHQQPFRLSREQPAITAQVIAAMCPPEVRCWMSLALSCIGAVSSTELSNIAKVGQGGRTTRKTIDVDKETEGELEAHQRQYMDAVRRTKEGLKVFTVLYYGLLYIYADSGDHVGEAHGVSASYPYGKQEMVRLAMSSVDLDESVDLVNDLFFIHLDFITEELETLFVLSKFLNMISSPVVNPRKMTLQYHSYSEMITWKTIFEQHAQYAQYSIARLPALAPTVKFHGTGLVAQPSIKTVWLVEKLSSKMRRRIFVKIDRGWFIVFPNDSSVSPSLANASEIFSLSTLRCEVSHRKVVRLRKWMTKIALFDDENDRKREFYFRSSEGELDADTKALLNALASNTTYAHSQFYRYLLPWLDDNDVFGDLCGPVASSAISVASTASRSGTVLNCVGCSVDLQVFVPEPQTSDDDSDVDADKDLDDSTAGSLFRVLKPKSQQTGSASAAAGGRSKSVATSVDFHSRFQHVNEKLQEEYCNFTTSYFSGRILLYQDLNLLLLLHANRLVGVVNVSRCVERNFPVRKARRGEGSPRKTMDNSLYSLASDDEDDDSSDRDYFEDAAIGDGGKTWIIQLVGYDGRVYRIKFSNAVEYDDWRKCFALRCVSPATISTKVTLTKPSRSESFKGNHSFEFLKEHMVSSVESTASTSSLSSSSSASVLASSSAAPSSLLSSMLSGAGKLVSSMKVSEDRRAWEPTVDSEATKKFSRSLRVSEKVFASGIVLKHEKTMNNASAASAPKQKRILLITDAPRMMFIDTIGNIARGNVDLLSDSKIEVKEVDGSDFEVIIAGNSNRFTPSDGPEKDTKFWVNVIQFAVGKSQ